MIVAHIGKSLLYGATTNCILLASITLVEIVVSMVTSIEIRLRLVYLALGASSWFLADDLIEPLSVVDLLRAFPSTMEQRILLVWVLALLFWTVVCSAIWCVLLLLRLRRGEKASSKKCKL